MRDGGASEGISGSSPPSPGPEGWVLYDGSCGICRHWIQSRENLLRRHGFAIAPLQAGWVAERLHLQEDNLLQDVRLLLADGRQIQGPDVYRYLMKRVLWTYPLYLLSVAPIVRTAFDWAYRSFAAHRHQVSRACGVSARY